MTWRQLRLGLGQLLTRRQVRAGSDGHGSFGVSVSSLAKWFVPTVSALFLIIGYVAQSAQDSLLGVPSQIDFPNGYLVDSANFLRDSVYLLLERTQVALSDLAHLGLLHHPTLILCSIGLGVAAWLLAYLPTCWFRAAVRIVQCGVIALVIGIFLTFDAPLLRVEHLLNSPYKNAGDGRDAYWSLQTLHDVRTVRYTTQRPGTVGSPVEKYVASRAADIFDAIVCSRVSSSTSKNIDRFYASPICKESQATLSGVLQDEFLANLILCALLALTCIFLVRLPINSLGTLFICGSVALAFLAVPYAYGKLLKSSEFEFGVVRPADTLVEKFKQPDVSIIPENEQTFNAALLSNSESGIQLLGLRPMPCPVAANTNGADRTTVILLSRIARDQFLSFEQIKMRDVIEMAASEGRQCGQTGGPPL